MHADITQHDITWHHTTPYHTTTRNDTTWHDTTYDTTRRTTWHDMTIYLLHTVWSFSLNNVVQCMRLIVLLVCFRYIRSRMMIHSCLRKIKPEDIVESSSYMHMDKGIEIRCACRHITHVHISITWSQVLLPFIILILLVRVVHSDDMTSISSCVPTVARCNSAPSMITGNPLCEQEKSN